MAYPKQASSNRALMNVWDGEESPGGCVSGVDAFCDAFVDSSGEFMDECNVFLKEL